MSKVWAVYKGQPAAAINGFQPCEMSCVLSFVVTGSSAGSQHPNCRAALLQGLSACSGRRKSSGLPRIIGAARAQRLSQEITKALGCKSSPELAQKFWAAQTSPAQSPAWLFILTSPRASQRNKMRWEVPQQCPGEHQPSPALLHGPGSLRVAAIPPPGIKRAQEDANSSKPARL